jgi:hypothetical protein
MNRVHSRRYASRTIDAKHPVACTCSDAAAICMGVPALAILLLGLWWSGIL